MEGCLLSPEASVTWDPRQPALFIGCLLGARLHVPTCETVSAVGIPVSLQDAFLQ